MITFANITLKDVTIHGSILPPGIVRCGPTNPCTGFVFDNVKADGWWKYLRANYITENVYGIINESHPAPGFITTEGDGFVSHNNFEELMLNFWTWIMGLFSSYEDDTNLNDIIIEKSRAHFNEAVDGFSALYSTLSN